MNDTSNSVRLVKHYPDRSFMASTSIDVASLHAALDAARSSKELSWRQLAALLELSPSTLSRLANGYTPDTTAFTSMVTWLNIPAERFITAEGLDEREQPDLVASLAPLLRARKDLKPEDVDHLEELISSAVRRFHSERPTREA
ncbi:helix-turn-helix transcriptional regulator [Microbacterium sp.]|uniref:helix-turn-helix domain-containing protein n=1 Tax=Microbacterium sp. TaxID=51671 RepID=UPI002735083F|nr:helix-turn-helix domain-containing protein [Microbacterium sp.]MDP3950081.1 helix-turn-helix domain-containing protein [Microbacterium sp.]